MTVEGNEMIKRADDKPVCVPWDADALEDALAQTKDEAEAWILARALVIRLIEDTKADAIQAKHLNENQAEVRDQVKAMTETLMRKWMRSAGACRRTKAVAISQ
ncbi:hypothetical protein H7849_07350 [Alloacidobacterium dinghuense]|uniref:Uncharacterized protein n=1 Tax=Alloacidobacterium dinghuense TaxID=2763107 RepID=A0A7G8BMF8_9BACT|nr:hypothetical protein [Alloacidobacterium dinghuense]QNI33728.1 hypothetical protein H7849_07350 [Alloacidobacterium dinghuense]